MTASRSGGQPDDPDAPPSVDPEQAAVRAAELDASRILGRRDRSRADLVERLAARGHEEAAIASALDRLASRGLFDERRSAESRAFILLARRGFARARVASTLIAERFPESIVEAATSAALESARAVSTASADRSESDGGRSRPDRNDDDAARARELAVRAAHELRARERDARARSIAGRLARRGFDADTIAASLEHVGLGDLLPDDQSI